MKIRFGAALLLLIAALALLSPMVASHDPLAIDVPARFAAPGSHHWLGTDEFGRDVLARLLHGGRVSLLVAACSVLIAALIGISSGLVVTFSAPWLDQAALLVCDVTLAFPGILLALLFVALAGPSLWNVVAAISILYAPVFLRLTRNMALHLREADFVLACRLLSVPRQVVLFREVLPNLAAPLLAQAVTCFAWALIAETSLSFLGLGAQPPTPSWGAMLASARDYLDFSSINAIAPACAIFVTVWAANLVAEGLQTRGDQ